MNLMLAFINLFMAPLISVSIDCRRRNAMRLSGLRALCLYGSYTVVNTVFAHGLTFLINRITWHYIAPDTAKFTVLALAGAVLLPYLAEIGRALFKVECRIRPAEKNGRRARVSENDR